MERVKMKMSLLHQYWDGNTGTNLRGTLCYNILTKWAHVESILSISTWFDLQIAKYLMMLFTSRGAKGPNAEVYLLF